MAKWLRLLNVFERNKENYWRVTLQRSSNIVMPRQRSEPVIRSRGANHIPKLKRGETKKALRMVIYMKRLNFNFNFPHRAGVTEQERATTKERKNGTRSILIRKLEETRMTLHAR